MGEEESRSDHQRLVRVFTLGCLTKWQCNLGQGRIFLLAVPGYPADANAPKTQSHRRHNMDDASLETAKDRGN
jgi:hypothetical protein